MASLTDQLSTDVGGIKPVRQAPQPNNGLASALNALSKGIDVVDSTLRQRRQNEQQAAQEARRQKDDARKEEENLIPYLTKNAYDQAVLDTQRPQEGAVDGVTRSPMGKLGGNVFGNVDSPLSGPMAADTSRAISDLNNIQTAVNQKKMPNISFNSALNKRVSELMAKYPSHGDKILGVMKSAGLEASLFRMGNDEQSDHENVREAGEKWGNDMFEKGSQSLDPNVMATMSREQVIAQGAAAANTEYKLDQATKSAELVLKNQNISAALRKDTEDNLNDSINQITVNEAWNNSAPIMTALQSAMGAIGKMPISQQKVAWEQLAPQYDQWAANYKAKAIAQASASGMTDPAKLVALGTTIDDMVQRGRTMWSGDMSVASSQQRALLSVTTKLNLDIAQSMPVFFALQKMGISADEISGLTEGLTSNPELVKALQKEMKGFNGEFGQKNASTRLMDIVSLLKGQKGLEDMEPAEARAAMPTLYKTANSYAKMYSTGQGDVNPDTMLSALGQIITATRTISPATASTNSIKFATGGVARPETRRALFKALKDPAVNDMAEATITGSRAASAQIINAMRNSKNFGAYDTKFWKLQLDKNDGRAYAVPTGARASPLRGDSMDTKLGISGGFESVPTKAPKELQVWAETYNANIQNVSELNAVDPNGIKGATPMEVAKYYSLGVVPKALQGERSKEANPQKEIDTILGTIEDAFDGVGDMNSPISISNIVAAEGTGKNPRSSAEGTGQFIESTWMNMMEKYEPDLIQGKSREEILDMRNDKKLGTAMTQRYAQENASILQGAGLPVNGLTTYLMHFAGPQGGVRLLRASPDVPVESVIGRQAVAANPHLRGKTVAETIQWAKRFVKA